MTKKTLYGYVKMSGKVQRVRVVGHNERERRYIIQFEREARSLTNLLRQPWERKEKETVTLEVSMADFTPEVV